MTKKKTKTISKYNSFKQFTVDLRPSHFISIGFLFLKIKERARSGDF